MIQNLHELPPNQSLTADLVIIGAGAAGMALAREFFNSPHKVLLLESGSFADDAPTQNLYDTKITALPFTGATAGRFRTMGGSTTRWGGQALPLCPIDFEPRDWVSHSGWPIPFESLAPYYTRAAKYLNVDEFNFDTDLFPKLHTNPPAVDPAIGYYHYSKWSPHPNLREIYRPQIEQSQNVTLLLNANVTSFQLTSDKKSIAEIHIRTLSGNSAIVHPKLTVLSVGGIETARLLLATKIANSSGLVGKFFQDHPGAVIGEVHPPSNKKYQRLFNIAVYDKRKYSVRVSASPQLQQKEKILNATATTTFEIPESAPINLAKKTYTQLRQKKIGGQFIANCFRCLFHLPSLISPLYQFFAHHRVYAVGATLNLGLTVEQDPSAESHITLSEERDALNMPKSQLHWQLSPLVRKTFQTYALALAKEFERLHIGAVQLRPWITDDSLPWLQNISDQNHHMGTARMSEDPTQGVVNENLFTHDIPTLAICSAAVFPTSGHSNPTFTLLALTMRLADTLKSRL